jgi:hypothetical protein
MKKPSQFKKWTKLPILDEISHENGCKAFSIQKINEYMITP